MGNIDKAALKKLKQELKPLLIEALSLDEVEETEISDNEILFGEGLGLDSLDAVEIAVMLQRNFNIEIKNAGQARDIFYSIDTLARYIYKNKE
jgi:acyl carrier protein